MKKITTSIVLLILFFVFRNWFSFNIIIGGDWPYYFPKLIEQFTLFAPSWVSYTGNGFGGILILYALDSYVYFFTHIFVNLFGSNWDLFGKFFFFYAFLLISYSSILFLYNTIFSEDKKLSLFSNVAVVLYILNTYVLLMVGGGQMGIALAYAISPYVIGLYIRLIKFVKQSEMSKKTLGFILLSGFFLGLTMVFDSRVAYLLVFFIGILFLFEFFKVSVKTTAIRIAIYLIASGCIALLLNSFWIIPLLIYGNNPVNELEWSYKSVGFFQFLSFSDFSHSLSLLHPNWPENIFGKTYFMRSEFLLFPILAYSSLLFIFQVKSKELRFLLLSFVTTGLLGSFLGKGLHEPFGEINKFLFLSIPGFGFFRDPTKFYIFTALSYSVLIPFSIFKINEFFNTKFNFTENQRRYTTIFILLVFIGFYCFSIREIFLEGLPGTFAKKSIPSDYKKLENYLSSQKDFYRTLWIPHQQRFNYYSNTHPAVASDLLYKTATFSAIVTNVENDLKNNRLKNMAIKYIIVPEDTEKEIFVKDRKYDAEARDQLIYDIKKISHIKPLHDFGNIAVFEIPNPKGHFNLNNGTIHNIQQHSTVRYTLDLTLFQATELEFLESYSPYWKLKYDTLEIESTKSQMGFNTFKINKSGRYTVEVYHVQEEGYLYARVISSIVLVVLVLGIIYSFLLPIPNLWNSLTRKARF